jgi:hypothetical protein
MSLRFPAEKAAPPRPELDVRSETPRPILERDYRTVACPMNFVKVKRDLAQMQKGQRWIAGAEDHVAPEVDGELSL